jgi:hypothetical protein
MAYRFYTRAAQKEDSNYKVTRDDGQGLEARADSLDEALHCALLLSQKWVFEGKTTSEVTVSALEHPNNLEDFDHKPLLKLTLNWLNRKEEENNGL